MIPTTRKGTHRGTFAMAAPIISRTRRMRIGLNQPFMFYLLSVFRLLYTHLVIDNNHLPMLPLAKKLGGMAWTTRLSTMLNGGS